MRGVVPSKKLLALLVGCALNRSVLKIASFLIVVTASLYHHWNLARPDESCAKLLENGTFLTGDVWQPQGCQMHNYSLPDIEKCMRTTSAATGNYTRIYFIGDSRVRGICNGFLLQIRSNMRVKKEDKKYKPDLMFTHEKFSLEVHSMWRPILTREVALSLLETFRMKPPSLVVMTNILHRNEGSVYNTEAVFTEGITTLTKGLDHLGANFPVLFLPAEPYYVPNLEMKKKGKRNKIISHYNKIAEQVFNSTRVTVPHSLLKIGTIRNWDYPDGIHPSPNTVSYFVQILFNFFCNRHVPNISRDVCCGAFSSFLIPLVGVLVVAGLCCCGMCLPIYLITRKKDLCTALPPPVDATPDQEKRLHQHPQSGCNERVVKWMGGAWFIMKLAFIMGYFVLCDRVQLMPHDDKHFSFVFFYSTLGIAVVTAILTRKLIESSKSNQPTLQRDITNEWKGWMQLVLLVYHGTGASQNLPIYLHMRIIVSSYLFLTGYGHFTHFWKRGSAGGLVRYAQTMFRLNFLTAMLCLVMDQPYMNYYFIPMVSFWFTALHLVLSVPLWRGHRSPDTTLLDVGGGVLRIALMAALVALLSSAQVFQTVFESWPLRPFFQLAAEDGVVEWRFRWMLDRFSVLYGMVFALACQAWYQYRPGDANFSVWPKTTLFAALLCVASLVCLSSYVMLLQFCDDKVTCNLWHPYLTWIPILGYILFRHHNALFRTTFSPWLVWLGRISLELFVCQYHIFLANNTDALLVLVPGPALANSLVSGLVMLCVADELNLMTASVQRTLVLAH